MRIHAFYHVPFEGLASIEDWIRAHRHTLSSTRLYASESLPHLDEIDWLIVMGGPMNIYEEDKHLWLVAEKAFIAQAITAQKIVLGICLGAQLIADVLGAKITRNAYPEIGWFPINFAESAHNSSLFNFLPEQMTALHWHGDTFDLPPGATLIASSAGCAHQAFLYGERVVALQFHLEATRASTQALVDNATEVIVPQRYIQAPGEILDQNDNFTTINQAMVGILDRLAAV